MTSHELAHQLLAGPDLPVHISYCYGDYWKTQVAPAVDTVTDGVVVHSDYHNMDKVLPEDDQEDGNERQRQVILLS